MTASACHSAAVFDTYSPGIERGCQRLKTEYARKQEMMTGQRETSTGLEIGRLVKFVSEVRDLWKVHIHQNNIAHSLSHSMCTQLWSGIHIYLTIYSISVYLRFASFNSLLSCCSNINDCFNWVYGLSKTNSIFNDFCGPWKKEIKIKFEDFQRNAVARKIANAK